MIGFDLPESRVETIVDKAVGSLVGLAIGDAMGMPVEFKKKGTFEPVTGFRAGGPFSLNAGEWTDDTSMAIALGSSLLEKKEYDARHIADQFIAWYRHGKYSHNGRCFDIGNATSDALQMYEKHGDPIAGSLDPMSAGNGALMRLVPAIITNLDHEFRAANSGSCQGQITHRARESVAATQIFGTLLFKAIHGKNKRDTQIAIRQATTWVRYTQIEVKIKQMALGEIPVQGSGYCVDSLGSALWAFEQSETFADGLLKAVNLGNDSDTTGAIYGQIAGATYGLSGIPANWIEQLVWGEQIVKLARDLVAMKPTPSKDRGWIEYQDYYSQPAEGISFS